MISILFFSLLYQLSFISITSFIFLLSTARQYYLSNISIVFFLLSPFLMSAFHHPSFSSHYSFTALGFYLISFSIRASFKMRNKKKKERKRK